MLDFLFTIVSKGLKSKSLIVGWVTFVAGLLSFLVGSDFIQQYPELVSALATVSGVVTMVLRYVTRLPLELKETVKE